MNKNRKRIEKFCKELGLDIISLEYIRNKDFCYGDCCDSSYWELFVKMPFGYKEHFTSDLVDNIEEGIDIMFDHIEAELEHIYNVRTIY